MPNFSVKDVPETWAEALRTRAARNHRSLQGELMAILEVALNESAARIQEPGDVSLASVSSLPSRNQSTQGHRSTRHGWKTVDQIAAELRAKYPHPIEGAPLGVDIIRADRDSR